MNGVLGMAIAVSIVSMKVPGEAAPAPKDACLGVVASGFSSAVGHAILRLYRPGDDVTRPPPLSRPVAIKDGSARWCVDVGPLSDGAGRRPWPAIIVRRFPPRSRQVGRACWWCRERE